MIGLHNLVAAINGHRHHGRPGLAGNAESPGLELAHGIPLRARALRKHHYAFTGLHKRLRLPHGLHRVAGAFAVDEHTIQQLHPGAHQRNLPCLNFGHQRVRLVQIHQHQGDVIIALMVRCEHHSAFFRDILLPFYCDSNARNAQQRACPHAHIAVDIDFCAGVPGRFFALCANHLRHKGHQCPKEIQKPNDCSQQSHAGSSGFFHSARQRQNGKRSPGTKFIIPQNLAFV